MRQTELFPLTDFVKYHTDNPHIYEEIVNIAKSLKRAGRTHYGMKGIFEKLRFDHAISGNDSFKINNNYTPHYARLVMVMNPDLKGFFELRKKTTS